MEARIAVAKVGKYATSESGDSLEMIERPAGGLSFVLSDGQTSGKSAKAISNAVTRKAISLLADGVRDGAAARAASDYLYTYRSGKVLATLNILSIDLQSQTLVITRNNPVPVILIHEGTVRLLADASEPVGTRRGIRPLITEVPLSPGLAAVVFTDGLTHAGDRVGTPMDTLGVLQRMAAEGPVDPDAWADRLLAHAVALDQGRPADDISILVTAILQRQGDDARRLSVRMPL
ncbi:MAG: serine/threonine-protein phosphatase [Anaerolineales bacterium]|nr:serine/threonine-protein phosphatase [Anaerolineales bacterium]